MYWSNLFYRLIAGNLSDTLRHLDIKCCFARRPVLASVELQRKPVVNVARDDEQKAMRIR